MPPRWHNLKWVDVVNAGGRRLRRVDLPNGDDLYDYNPTGLDPYPDITVKRFIAWQHQTLSIIFETDEPLTLACWLMETYPEARPNLP